MVQHENFRQTFTSWYCAYIQRSVLSSMTCCLLSSTLLFLSFSVFIAVTSRINLPDFQNNEYFKTAVVVCSVLSLAGSLLCFIVNGISIFLLCKKTNCLEKGLSSGHEPSPASEKKLNFYRCCHEFTVAVFIARTDAARSKMGSRSVKSKIKF